MIHVGITEIAEMLGVTKARARAIIANPRQGFPAPVVDMPRRRAWRKPTVERWIERNRP